MADQKEQPATRLGQRADPPFMVQPPGCWYTPDEVGRMLGNRVVQPHYAAWLVRKAIEAAALRAAPAWQPIETAPRDGAPVWAFNGEQAPMLYIAGEGYALWIWADQVLADVDPSPEQPTHWMPLPEPPLAARPQGVSHG